jgi:hypothetical protein
MTLDPVAVLVGFGLVGLWLAALTAGQVRARRREGDPVFRRMPDGRIRFEWSVMTAYHAARRRHGRRDLGSG